MASNITFYKENTVTINLAFDGVDLTGATVYFTVKEEFDEDEDDSTALIQKDITSHIDATGGETAVVLSPADTDVAAGKYYYDIKLKKADNTQTTIQLGRCTIKDAVTNRG